MHKSMRRILIDFDETLHQTGFVYSSKLDGLFGLKGGELYHTFLSDIHRKIIHARFPERHNDLDFQLRLLLEHLGETYDSENANLLTVRFNKASEAIIKNPVFFPDAAAFLDHALKGGYKLCLSTGGGRSLQKADAITKFFGRNYFQKVVGEELLGHLKHSPLYYRSALRKLGWEANDTVSVGDTILTDILPAKAVGINTIWINRKYASSSPKTKPDYTASDLLSALKYLDKCNKR